MAGLQQGDREGEDEVTRHHQQQQDPEHVCHQGSINAERKMKTISNLAVLECWSAPQRVEVGEGQQDAWEYFQCGVINEDK